MCDPVKTNPIGDLVAGIGAVADAVGRVTTRIVCRRFTSERLADGRRKMLWLVVLFAAETAAIMYSPQRAMVANAGLVCVFSVAWYAATCELQRRETAEPEEEEAKPPKLKVVA
jgi:hypothetical protein